MSASTTQSRTTNQTTSRRQGPREGSVVWAMIQVLDGKRTPLTPAEILAAIQKRGLAKKLGGKTPEASVAARLAVHVGIYFERPEKGKYLLKKGVTAKSLASDSGSKSASTTTMNRSSGSKTARAGKPVSKGRRQGTASTSTATTTAPSTEPTAKEIATSS
jgi:hypothetical protein